MIQKYGFLLACSLFLTLGTLAAQKDADIIQFSGMVLDGSTQELFPIPYVNILVKDKGRGTYSDFNGFFSLVVEKGDVIEFSAVGYSTVRYTIPDTLRDNRYSLVQLMSQDIINLPETVVFPWPSRDHFKVEFLAMDVSMDLQDRAAKNLAAETLTRMRSEVASDGVENTSFYLRQQSSEYYHIGQRPPMNIFSPVAWKQFFDSWQRGDFKKKSK